MSAPTIRMAAPDDIESITRIYNHYILESTATFDTEPKTVEDRASWLRERDAAHPVLVAEGEGKVLGWGSLSPWAQRPAWRHSVEVSIYIDANATGQGIGPALLVALTDHARRAGHHAMLSQIVADNEPSLKLSRRAGFEHVGTLREVGRKFDRWLDVALVELVLEQ